MLTFIGIALVLVIAVFLIYAATKPDTFSVQVLSNGTSQLASYTEPDNT
jgi:Na+-transporting methylmalonyl-CoA/oxaloacetate decarboxylase gamma subunit